MGSHIEINDTLKLSKEQGFPTELDFNKHISENNRYFKKEMLENKIFEFKNLPGIRVFKIPPV